MVLDIVYAVEDLGGGELRARFFKNRTDAEKAVEQSAEEDDSGHTEIGKFQIVVDPKTEEIVSIIS